MYYEIFKVKKNGKHYGYVGCKIKKIFGIKYRVWLFINIDEIETGNLYHYTIFRNFATIVDSAEELKNVLTTGRASFQ